MLGDFFSLALKPLLYGFVREELAKKLETLARPFEHSHTSSSPPPDEQVHVRGLSASTWSRLCVPFMGVFLLGCKSTDI